MDWVDVLQWSSVCVCLLAFAALVYLVWRRYRLVSGRGAFECYHRKAGLPEKAHWSHGIVRYRRDAVVWYPLVALGFKPGCRIPRLRVSIGQRRNPSDAERAQLAQPVVIVPITAGAGDTPTCEWAMSRGAADGLLAWAEAAPPGEGQYGHTRPPGGGVTPAGK
ncbi:MAG: DUF2550 domain-containing protein [Propionibacteriaceae bacterium]|jgi:hypothetical protein|nr:DUF2550 domain-containing protein [Propionibacteriaceae bacterium]